MRRDSINTNSAYLEVGFLAQKELPQQDLDPFLKSLLAQNFRARTSEQYTAAALEHLRRWKSCTLTVGESGYGKRRGKSLISLSEWQHKCGIFLNA